MAFTVYMLECADGSLYVGHSDNLELRMQQHDSGTGNADDIVRTETAETRKAAKIRAAAHQREFLALITEVSNDLCIFRH